MYADPEGNSTIALMIGIGTLVGGAIGFGLNTISQLRNNGRDITEVDWTNTVNPTIVGAGLGFSLSMGVAYLGPAIAGASASEALSVSGAFAISTAVSFAAGALGYILEEHFDGDKPLLEKAIMHGGFVALEGIVNFGVGGMVGSIGTIGSKGVAIKSGEWWGKLILGFEFSQPFKFGIDCLRNSI